MATIEGREGRPDYAMRIMDKLAEIFADMLLKGDYQALYEFGNQINGLAARRGLPHEEPVALLTLENLTPEDFEKGAA